ncbi:MAG: MoaD/ThiS family protein [Methanomicrobium sp.]|nr:MoaD/ThiS family protein [Methanomicrobium sp.]MBR6010808.1 MoaD/ThiS family protein [Methanomicrobium sp.]MBR6447308.1 MoaD/ThiS family protein [Methanomicrobium sp.]MBR6496825.1 MoaD/ThiS family protein [Methanomicrobium sp.]
MKITLPDKIIIERKIQPSVIRDILKSLDINPSSVIVAKNGNIVPDDVIIEDADELKIIAFAHGG